MALAVQPQSQITAQKRVDDNADEVDSVFRYDYRGVPVRDICKPLYREPRLHHLQPRQHPQHQHQQPTRRHHNGESNRTFSFLTEIHTLPFQYGSFFLTVVLVQLCSNCCTGCSLGNWFNSSIGATAVGSRKTASVSRCLCLRGSESVTMTKCFYHWLLYQLMTPVYRHCTLKS